MNIITGYRGEPHITSAQDRAGNQGSYGTGSYVLNVGNKLAATIASANEIRIADGALCHQGCLANIDAGTYDSVAINNGTQGMNRIDRIVARYTKNAETNVESLDLVVIEGTAVSGTPSAPAYNTGNIQNGDSPVDMPLYQVRLTGVTVASVTKEFDYVRTQKELDTAVSSLNSNLAISLSGGNGVIYSSWPLYKRGNIVFLQVDAIASAPAGNTSLGVIIPSGYRPAANINFTLIRRANISSSIILALTISQTGEAAIYNYGSAISSATPFGGLFSWPVA